MDYTFTENVKVALLAAMLPCLTACASSSGDSQIKPRQTLECPYGMMLICESQTNEPSSGGDEDIPEYDRCHCQLNPT